MRRSWIRVIDPDFKKIIAQTRLSFVRENIKVLIVLDDILEAADAFSVVEVNFFAGVGIDIKNVCTGCDDEYCLIMIEHAKVRLIIQLIRHLIHHGLLLRQIIENKQTVFVKEKQVVVILLTKRKLNAGISKFKLEYLFKFKCAVFAFFGKEC